MEMNGVETNFGVGRSGVGVRLKVGDKYLRRLKGLGLGRGSALPRPQKKKICAKNYAILSKFWYFFPILQQKVGDYTPVLKVGDLSPCPPCSDAYGVEEARPEGPRDGDGVLGEGTASPSPPTRGFAGTPAAEGFSCILSRQITFPSISVYVLHTVCMTRY